jgi:hypothetical protein
LGQNNPESLTLKVISFNAIAVVGVPEISPLELKLRPSGSVPPSSAMENVYGGVPPLAVSWNKYGTPTSPGGGHAPKQNMYCTAHI